MYDLFNEGTWENCFALIDPKLTDDQKVERSLHAKQLQAFKHIYGTIKPWHVRISLHLDASPQQQDKRPFAFVYVVWQDAVHGFHMFRDRKSTRLNSSHRL